MYLIRPNSLLGTAQPTASNYGSFEPIDSGESGLSVPGSGALTGPGRQPFQIESSASAPMVGMRTSQYNSSPYQQAQPQLQPYARVPTAEAK